MKCAVKPVTWTLADPAGRSRIRFTMSLLRSLSGSYREITSISDTPPRSRWGEPAAATPGTRSTRAVSRASWAPSAPCTASSIGESRCGGNSVLSAVST